MSQTLSAATLLAVPLAPLAGSLIAGILGTAFGGNRIGRTASHTSTILGVFIAFVLSALTLKSVLVDGARDGVVARLDGLLAPGQAKVPAEQVGVGLHAAFHRLGRGRAGRGALRHADLDLVGRQRQRLRRPPPGGASGGYGQQKQQSQQFE